MTLPMRALGTSGLHITTVGFGAWAAGGGGWSFGWGPQDDEASIAAMRHAIDRGRREGSEECELERARRVPRKLEARIEVDDAPVIGDGIQPADLAQVA